jgi:tetratricopeptide (TPR) repeat protein
VRKTAFLLGVLSAVIVGTLSGYYVLNGSMPLATTASKPHPMPVPRHPLQVLVWRVRDFFRGKPPPPIRPVPSDPRPILFQEAKNLIRAERWVEARARLLELQALAPEYPAIGDYLARVEQEIPNQQHLMAAKEALEAKTLAVAKAQLDQVSPNTTMFERVAQLKRQLRDTADARVQEAQSLLDAGQREQALAIFADVVAVFPDHQLAKAGLEQAQFSLAVASGPPAWDIVARDFMKGEIFSAMVLAKACAPKVPRCKSGLEDLKEFSTLLKKMEDLDPDQLAHMVELDKQITGASVPSRATDKVRARQTYILYKNASAAWARGAWPRAMEFARRTLQVDPSHRGAAGIVQELSHKAKGIYRQAYTLKDTDPQGALPLFYAAMDMTPPDDEIHQKAKHWIEKLDPRGKTRR